MGQKVHPTSLRLYKTNRFAPSAWFSQLYYTDLLLKDYYTKKLSKNILFEGKYFEPIVFTSFWKRHGDLFVFFLSNKKQFRKLNYRFPIRKKVKIKKTPLLEKILPGKKAESYKKMRHTNLLWEKKIYKKDSNKKKIYLETLLLHKIQYEEKY